MAKSLCSVVEHGKPCEREHAARGYCEKHWRRWREHGDPLIRSAPKPDVPKPVKACSVDGCEKRVKALGWCSMHWKRARNNDGDPRSDLAPRPMKQPERVPRVATECSEDGCIKPARGRGLCQAHYTRMVRHGSTSLPPPKPRKRCSVDACEAVHYAKGYCRNHWERWKRWGDPNAGEFWITREFRLSDQGYMRRVITVNGKRHYQAEHRYLMEQLLGRPLLRTEEVHHVNRDRSDNRIGGCLDETFTSGNLQLWTTRHPKGARVSDMIAHFVTNYPDAVRAALLRFDHSLEPVGDAPF